MAYQRWTEPVHPIATTRMRARQPGEAFPCYRCGVGDSMADGHECQECVARRLVPVFKQFKQLDMFGADDENPTQMEL